MSDSEQDCSTVSGRSAARKRSSSTTSASLLAVSRHRDGTPAGSSTSAGIFSESVDICSSCSVAGRLGGSRGCRVSGRRAVSCLSSGNRQESSLEGPVTVLAPAFCLLVCLRNIFAIKYDSLLCDSLALCGCLVHLNANSHHTSVSRNTVGGEV